MSFHIDADGGGRAVFMIPESGVIIATGFYCPHLSFYLTRRCLENASPSDSCICKDHRNPRTMKSDASGMAYCIISQGLTLTATEF